MERPRIDRDLRELLLFLRDTFSDAATRIDDYIARQEGPRGRDDRDRGPSRDSRDNRDPRDNRDARDNRDSRDNRAPREFGRDQGPSQSYGGGGGGGGGHEAVHGPLEKLRDEVRQISAEAGDMDPALLRLQIEAVTAETRSLQARAVDPDDNDIAAKIMRALTAIVSDHRPGHVYGLARYHQADWDDVARRARAEIRGMRENAPNPIPSDPSSAD